MAEVEVTINGRSYRIACDDGQETHLIGLSHAVDRRIQGLVETVGQVGDARLLVMACLVLADEVADAEARLERREAEAAGGEAAAAAIEALAQRIEGIADRLSPP